MAKLIVSYYFTALVLNLLIPYGIAKSIVGNHTGDANMIVILGFAWSFISAIVYLSQFLLFIKMPNTGYLSIIFIPSLIAATSIIIAPQGIFIMILNIVINTIFYIKFRQVKIK